MFVCGGGGPVNVFACVIGNVCLTATPYRHTTEREREREKDKDKDREMTIARKRERVRA